VTSVAKIRSSYSVVSVRMRLLLYIEIYGTTLEDYKCCLFRFFHSFVNVQKLVEVFRRNTCTDILFIM
jgi:hypothetical protein